MRQMIIIDWYEIEHGNMPSEEGTCLVAWDDGTVESYPLESKDIDTGRIRSGQIKGLYWARPIPSPIEE